MGTKGWTYEGYWHAVLGQGTSVDVVREHELGAEGLDEWLGLAEVEAARIGGVGSVLPEEWAEYHKRALAALTEEGRN